MAAIGSSPPARRRPALGLVLLLAACGRGEAPGGASAPPGPPAIVQVRILPIPAYVTSTLTADARAVDPGRRGVELHYRWIRNGTEIPEATGVTLRAPAFKRGDEIAVRVSPRAGGAPGPPTTSAAVTVLNSPPILRRVTLGPEAPRRGDTLRASVEGYDPDGDPLEFAYRWVRNGADMAGGTGPTLAAAALRKGDRVSVQVVATDGEGRTAPRESAPVTIGNTPPRVLSAGNWQHGPDGALVTQIRAEDPDGDVLTFALSPGAPRGMTIDPRSGVLRWRPGPEDAGTHRFGVVISDGDGGIIRQDLDAGVRVE